MRDDLKEWANLIQAESHVLVRSPSLLFQQAANYPDNSAPARAAGRRLVAGLEKRTWLHWANKPQGRAFCLLTLTGHTGAVSCCAFSPDGSRIISGSADGTLRLWRAATGELIAVLAGHGYNGIEKCSFSPDGKWILSSVGEIPSSTGVQPLTAIMAGLIQQGPPDQQQAVAGDISLWDARLGAHVRAFALEKTCRGSITICRFSPDGGRIMAGGGEYAPGWLKVWEVTTGRELLSITGQRQLRAGGWSHDGRRILAAWDGEKSLQVLDAASGRAEMTLHASFEDPTACACSADGKWILFASWSHLWLWDARTGELLRDFEPRSLGLQDCEFSPDSTLFVSRSYQFGEVSEKAATLWNPNTGGEVAWLGGHAAEVLWVTFSPNGSRLATASFDGTVKLWDASSKAEIATLKGHGSAVNTCTFSPDGAWILSASHDKTLKLWDPSVASVVRRESVIIHPDRVRPGPAVVTAWMWDGTCAFGCPACRMWSKTSATAPGSETCCPRCSAKLKLNPFTIDADWERVASAWAASH